MDSHEQRFQNQTILAADGGIREHTVAGLRLAGAEAIVMGSLALSALDPTERIAWVHTLPVAAHVNESANVYRPDATEEYHE